MQQHCQFWLLVAGSPFCIFFVDRSHIFSTSSILDKEVNVFRTSGVSCCAVSLYEKRQKVIIYTSLRGQCLEHLVFPVDLSVFIKDDKKPILYLTKRSMPRTTGVSCGPVSLHQRRQNAHNLPHSPQ